ncbi:hypothetical protein DRA43_00280 [Micromonospora provocatoris]|nr:hypothetical protein DRA43_00280 [Micromonospora provocatoris]
MCAEVAAGLAAIHEAGLVHRDVKPGNVLLAPDGAKLVDLGVALAVGSDTVDSRGEIRGTPSYMAPEQLRGEPAVPACDVYALGLLLTECLTGRPPARPDQPDRDDGGAALRTEGTPEGVEELRRRCLAADPTDRPSADTVARLLSTVAVPDVVRLRPATGARPAPRPTLSVTSRSLRRRRVRRAALVGGLPAILAAAVLVAQLPGTGSTNDASGVPDTTPTQNFGCTVTYGAERARGTFSADLTVEVTGRQPTGRPCCSSDCRPVSTWRPRWTDGSQGEWCASQSRWEPRRGSEFRCEAAIPSRPGPGRTASHSPACPAASPRWSPSRARTSRR